MPELNSLIHTVELGTLLDTEIWNRLRWQCRRGLLELDLVLERFLEKHCDQLQGERLSSFQALLTYTDDELWDLVRARTKCRDARFAEVFFTAVFVFVIASTSRKSMPVGQVGLTVGLTLTVIHLISIPIDNTSVNPARSLSTAVFQGSWALSQLWVFIAAPLVGGVVAALVYQVFYPKGEEQASVEPAREEQAR